MPLPTKDKNERLQAMRERRRRRERQGSLSRPQELMKTQARHVRMSKTDFLVPESELVFKLYADNLRTFGIALTVFAVGYGFLGLNSLFFYHTCGSNVECIEVVRNNLRHHRDAVLPIYGITAFPAMLIGLFFMFYACAQSLAFLKKFFGLSLFSANKEQFFIGVRLYGLKVAMGTAIYSSFLGLTALAVASKWVRDLNGAI